MSEKPRFHLIRSTAYLLLTLSVLYILSCGPVFAFYVSGKNSKEAYYRFLTFYAPIVWADSKTPLHYVIGPYLIFWERIAQQ